MGDAAQISSEYVDLVSLGARQTFGALDITVFTDDNGNVDASDVKIAATFIKYWDYIQLSSMIASSNTTHNGLKTLSLLINTEYSAWEWYSCVPFTHFSMQESQPIRTLDLSSPLLLSSFCLPVSPSSPS